MTPFSLGAPAGGAPCSLAWVHPACTHEAGGWQREVWVLPRYNQRRARAALRGHGQAGVGMPAAASQLWRFEPPQSQPGDRTTQATA